MPLLSQIIVGLLCMTSLTSRADLRVYPTRIALNDTKRVADISLRHIGTQAARYKINLVFYRMKPDGSMQLVDNPETSVKPEEHSALKLLRFSPRSVTLTPNNEQVIRIMYTGPKDLADGEYRAHIYFEPLDEPESTSPPQANEKKTVTMHLQAKVAVAVPIIYKKGKINSILNFTQLKVTNAAGKPAAYSVTLKSSGNAFPFGDLYAIFTAPGKEPVTVGVVRSISSYVPERTFSYPLAPPAGIKIAAGTLRVELRSSDEEGTKVLAFAETHVN